MGLRERDRAAPGAGDPAPPSAPRRSGDLRRMLALAVALAALVGFARLAAPEHSSSRLGVGASEGAGAAPEAGDPAGRPPRAGPPEMLLRRLDPSTLADVPANLLLMGPSDRPFPSDDGALLAVPDFQGIDIGEVVVVDARTFRPVATVRLEGSPITGLLGFTPEADAIIVQRRTGRGQTLSRHPLDPREGTTSVELPEPLRVDAEQTAVLGRGRVALLTTDRTGDDGESRRWTARVLVADLLEERVVVDLPLPQVRADPVAEVLRDAPLYFPGLAWDEPRERLYLAHADTRRLTVVDLASGRVEAEADLGTRARDTEQLAAGARRMRNAALSPDGARLYVGGRDVVPRADPPDRPLGLSVIDTATLTEVAHLRLLSESGELSPDGRWLAWTSYTAVPVTDIERADGVGFSRVGLLDTISLQQVALLGNGYRSSYALGFAQDSGFFYLQSDDGEGGFVVRAHALPSLEQTAERRLPGDAWFEPRGAYLREAGLGAS